MKVNCSMATPEEDGRVWEIHNLSARTDFIHPDYELIIYPTSSIGPTGKWVLFEIKHKNGYPVFRGRWDEKASSVDVDKVTITPGGEEKFSKKFVGHHTDRTDLTRWAFDIEIAPRSGLVFSGSVCFNVFRRVAIVEAIQMGVSSSCEVVRRPSRLRGLLVSFSTLAGRVVRLLSKR